MGTYDRRKTSFFNSKVGDDRRGRNKTIQREKRSLDNAWRNFLSTRARFRLGKATLSEVESALRAVNRERHHLHLPAVAVDVGIIDDGS